MPKIIRYQVGSDYKQGDRIHGSLVDMPVWGIDAIYDSTPAGKSTVHTNAIVVCTSGEDRRICLAALNGRLGLDLVGRPL